MASLREIRRKIKSVKSTEQITKAMKMVAAARMRRSQASILAARPFADKMQRLARGLALLERREAAAAGLPAPAHPFFELREGGADLLILIAGDKGLCGAFNANVLRAAAEWLRVRAGRKTYCIPVGRKARDFIHRLRGHDVERLAELAGVFPKVAFVHAELIGRAAIGAYRDGRVSRAFILYNEFKSVAQQRLLTSALLPVPEPELAPETAVLPDYGFEPRRGELLEALLPRHIKAQLYRVLLESQAAELAARMGAMDAASRNAKDLREALNLEANRTRQALITKEIAELVGGAEALAA
ncbi:MAG: ATP synthase F1 subunit gamma [Elusimicrobia bacterium]|nr:ATP synthase F1 subunit gamma [Elusimicrobiota bacterium]